MLYNSSRTCTNLYVLHLIPHKNLLTIDKIKKYSNYKLSTNQLINSIILREFRTRANQTAPTGLGSKLSDNNQIQNDKQDKKLSIFQLFQHSKEDEKLKKLLSQAKLTEDEKGKIKIAFAEGYLAASEKGGPKKQAWAFKIVDKLFLISFFLIIIYYLRERGFKNVLMGHRHEISPEEIDVTFNDALGIDEAKDELKDIVDFLRDPEKFTRLGAHLPKGVLLVGPPGTGKTLLARAVAGEAGVPFFHAAGSEFDEILVGQGARRIRDLFAAAKARSPCVVFIDEIDSVGGKRTNSVLHPYANQTINQLLSEMDGFRQNEGIIVLGATNRRNDLDNALLRPGRFDVEVRVSMPDLAGRKEILTYYLNKIRLADHIDVDVLAKRTLGFSGADIENMCNQAALKAAIEDEEGVTMKHLDNARDKVLMGPEKKKKIPDEDVNRLTAYHEAGHTLVAFYSENADPVHKVTIIPRGEALGLTAYIPEKEPYQTSRAMMLAKLDIAMGGRVAEELIFGEEKVTSGAYSDLKTATQIARTMVQNFGMSDRLGLAVHENKEMFNEISNNTLESIELEVKRLLEESYERAKKILKTHNKELHLVAQALLQYETLDLDQIKKIVNGEELSQIQTNKLVTK